MEVGESDGKIEGEKREKERWGKGRRVDRDEKRM